MSEQNVEACARLAKQDCVPCRGGVPPLEAGEQARLLGELGHGWTVVEGHHLEKVYSFPDFKGALAFTNAVGAIAEAQNHHPEIALGWGRVKVTVWTHKIDGLTENDFVLAARVEQANRDALH